MDTKAKLKITGVVFVLAALFLLISALMDRTGSKD